MPNALSGLIGRVAANADTARSGRAEAGSRASAASATDPSADPFGAALAAALGALLPPAAVCPAPATPAEGGAAETEDAPAGADSAAASFGDAAGVQAAPLGTLGVDAAAVQVAGGAAAEALAEATAGAAADAGAAGGAGAAGAAGAPAKETPTASSAAAAAKPPAGAAATAAALEPTLQARLARVVSRMHDEYGRDVAVVEGVRSQERQDYLYEQGRSRPGAVVTWTRHSQHTLGRAVDVTVDGSYDDPEAFRLLAQVAAEEGLHTLGARDPGHLELPRGIGEAVRAVRLEVAPAPLRNGAAAPAAVAAPAPVAGVAPVATVASVAAVAPVARPGMAAGPESGAADVARGKGHAEVDAAPAATPDSAKEAGWNAVDTGHAGGRSGAGGRDADRRSADEHGTPAAGATGAGRHFAAPTDGGTAQRETASPRSALGAAGPDVAARVGRVLEAQQGAELRPLSRVLLHLDGEGDGAGSIRVSLRGPSVEATIDLADRASADRLTPRLAELQHALERRGLEPASLEVRSPAASATTTTGMAARAAAETIAAPTLAQSGSDARPHGERHPGQPPGRQPREGEPQRQRSRRERRREDA